MDTWMAATVALLVGAVGGATLTFFLTRRNRGHEESVRRLRKELEGYKQDVTEHFVETAALVNDLTKSYKAVYDHLEKGAYRLIGEETLQRQLGNVKEEPVRLEYLGNRRGQESPPAGRTAPERHTDERQPNQSARTPSGEGDLAGAARDDESAERGNGPPSEDAQRGEDAQSGEDVQPGEGVQSGEDAQSGEDVQPGEGAHKVPDQ